MSLESASVEKSKQRELLSKMKKELKETEDFIEVHKYFTMCMPECN